MMSTRRPDQHQPTRPVFEMISDIRNAAIINHFAIMVVLGLVLCLIAIHHRQVFDTLMSVAGVVAIVQAMLKRHPLVASTLTHWDEAMGFCLLHILARLV